MKGRWGHALLATLAVAALASSSASAQPRGCYGVWVTPVPDQAQSERRAHRSLAFSVSEVLDLRFLVLVPAGTGVGDSDALYLKLITPKGHLYQKLRVPTETAASQEGERRRSRYRWVSASLPVAGTSIATSSLYGTWQVEPYVDGESSPCARARSFVIRE